MASELSGKVSYANGLAAPGVAVRVFDKDAPGNGDDDLTVTPGRTDQRGAFTVVYDPGRFQDFASIPLLGLHHPAASGETSGGIRFPDLTDIYLPYLQFSYSYNGETCSHTTQLALFQDHYMLPEAAPVHFKPSQDSFRFLNNFTGFMLPFSVPLIPPSVPKPYGLCGGMSAAAYDFLLAGRRVPQVETPPANGTNLQRYLFRRAIDSFAMGESIVQFARWMALPDDGPNGTYTLTMNEYQQIRGLLDNQRLVPLGLIYHKGKNAQEIIQNIWNNHQVLAYGYTENTDGSIDVHIYDPNEPMNDNVALHATKVPEGQTSAGTLYGLSTIEKGKKVTGPADPPVYGFFRMPYQPVEPPLNL